MNLQFVMFIFLPYSNAKSEPSPAAIFIYIPASPSVKVLRVNFGSSRVRTSPFFRCHFVSTSGSGIGLSYMGLDMDLFGLKPKSSKTCDIKVAGSCKGKVHNAFRIL